MLVRGQSGRRVWLRRLTGAMSDERLRTVSWDLYVGGLRSVGIRRRVLKSVGCLSEKRLLISMGKRVDEEEASCRRPDCR